MRVFHSFIVIVVVGLLLMFPMPSAIYDFRTDVRTDDFYYVTAAGQTTANVTLVKPPYDDDYQTISLFTDLSTDNATLASYNTTTRVAGISNLTADDERTISVSYDVDALWNSAALDTFLDLAPYLWFIFLFIFLIVSVYVFWKYRA